MAKRSEDALIGLLGLGEQSSRKSHYPELLRQLEQVELERNRYKWLFEHANYGIFQARINGGLRSVNPALVHMLGYEHADNLISTDSRKAEQLFAGGRRELDYIHTYLLSRGSLKNYESRLRCRNGLEVDVLLNMFMHSEEPGLVECFVADISERKRAQNQQLQLNQQLESRVAQRTRELHLINQDLQEQIRQRKQTEQALREARDAAEEANRSKDRYLAAASHDLLQPMNAARLLLSTLQERQLPVAEKHLLERAHLALEGAEELLSDLLDIARLDQSVIQPELDKCSLTELFVALESEFEPQARAAGVQLKAVRSSLWVKTDCHLLLRILRNFLSNACRYTGQGRIVLGARRRDAEVELQVWDTGPGLTAEQQHSMFTEFRQFAHEANAGRKGVGLGLAIVARIAAMLGAGIRVWSEPGTGSCFAVRVPLTTAPPRSVMAGTVAPVVPLGFVNQLEGKRMLVVDNEPDILLSMRALLEQWQCEVVTAADLQEARRHLAGCVPDMILADLHLDNGRNGLELIEALRNELECNIPAVLLTADHADEFVVLRKRLDVPMLNKPVRPSKLRALISQRLQTNLH